MTNCEKTEQFVWISCVNELRYSFVSYLSKALRQNGINDVVIDVDSDDLLSKESQEKIEKARVSVMVLPGNCDPTKVLLDKFVKFLDFQRNHDRLVVPVLYGDSPLQDEWLSALDLRGLSPIHESREECSDSILVEEIVGDVYEKLFYMGRIGIYPKLLEIEKMVCKQPLDICCVGIWGMPGIGKTTLTEAVFDQMSSKFDASCFIKDYDKVIHEKGLYRLLEEFFLKEKPGADGTTMKLSLLKNKLNNKRVLVVLDDVRNPLVAEPFLGGFDWFGPKSLIIITSRDKQVLRLCRVDQIYEVQGLNAKEGCQLFSSCACINDMAEQNLHDLSMKVIEYANGNPLALSIYGRELKGKKKLSEMETAFLKLKQRPQFKIVDAFKSSYDTLNDSEKNIFLDIACFFNGENVDFVMQLLEGCGFFPHVGINVLVEKRLVTISDNCVRMHNLIQDIGREIINGETVQIERRSRLWEPWSIKYLLEDNEHRANGEAKTTFKRVQGAKEIKGMFLDTSNLSFDIKPAAFDNLLNLRLLKIYCSNPEIHPVINFPNGSLHSLPNELRLLHWENYPSKNLPQNFDPRHLVEINMPYSELETLWGRTKNLEMLRTIRLCHSQQLVDISDLIKAKNLEVIDLQGCTKLQSFPATGQLLHLRDVDLSGCREMRNFPDVPPNIETLHLQGTGIRKLPIAKPNGGELVSLSEFQGLSDALKFERLTSLMKMSSSNQELGKLICLDLKDCFRLQSLPDMVNLELLRVLDLSGCSELLTIQGFPRNLKELYLAGTAVREVPQLPQGLELFNAHGCASLKSIRFDFEKLPVHYTFSNCFDLSPQVVNDFLMKALANAKLIPREVQQELNKALAFSFCGPSPPNQNSALDLQPGSSVVARLNSSWRNTLVGFAMLVEVAFSEDYCDTNGFGIRCVCRWKNKEGHSQRIERNLQSWAPRKAVPKVQKDHIFVFVDVNMLQSTDEGNDPNIWADLVVFEFFPASKQMKPLDDSCKVTRCGVRLINAATGYTSLEDISPDFSLDPMEVSGNEVEEVLRVGYYGLPEMTRVLFLYIVCLFNDEDFDLVAPLIARNIDLDVSSGLKVLADRSLIRISSNGEIGMHLFLRRMSKDILRLDSMLSDRRLFRYERLVDNSQSYVRNKKRKGAENDKLVCIPSPSDHTGKVETGADAKEAITPVKAAKKSRAVRQLRQSDKILLSMVGGAQETILLQGGEDNYEGVNVNLTEPMTVESFITKLRASLEEWRKQGKKGIWIKLADGLENLIAPAKAEGFEYHHAERDYLMLVSWISDSPSTIPANASHRIGISAFVLNKKTREVLVVQEIGGYFKGTGVWKLPIGVVTEGNNIWEGVLREVEEETGIKTKFVEVLSLRESHKSFLETKSDIVFICELEPITFEIKKQDSEILAAKWMPVEEYVNQSWNQKNELFRFMANICLKRSQEMKYVGFSKVLTTTATGKESYLYCNTDHANLFNATRSLSSTSTSTSTSTSR